MILKSLFQWSVSCPKMDRDYHFHYGVSRILANTKIIKSIAALSLCVSLSSSTRWYWKHSCWWQGCPPDTGPLYNLKQNTYSSLQNTRWPIHKKGNRSSWLTGLEGDTRLGNWSAEQVSAFIPIFHLWPLSKTQLAWQDMALLVVRAWSLSLDWFSIIQYDPSYLSKDINTPKLLNGTKCLNHLCRHWWEFPRQKAQKECVLDTLSLCILQ